jgi:hypothetical protein
MVNQHDNSFSPEPSDITPSVATKSVYPAHPKDATVSSVDGDESRGSRFGCVRDVELDKLLLGMIEVSVHFTSRRLV